MAYTKEDQKKIDETHDKVIEISIVLLGTNGDDGMCGDMKRITESHYKLKRNFWILVAFLAGSGVLGSGIWGITQLAH